MLPNTFLTIPGIGIKSEQALWEKGIRSWDDLFTSENIDSSRNKMDKMKNSIRESQEQLQKKNVHYFADRLPHNQYWRFFPEFRESTAYLDIETTALDPWLHSITVITLYDGKQIFSYIQGKNLDDFAKDVQKYSVLVTYNGRRFHLPFMAMYMGLKLNQVHIDLRYVLGSLGYTGGLKKCEEKAGIDRGVINDVDGCSAVILGEYSQYPPPGKKLGKPQRSKRVYCYSLQTLPSRRFLRRGKIFPGLDLPTVPGAFSSDFQPRWEGWSPFRSERWRSKKAKENILNPEMRKE